MKTEVNLAGIKMKNPVTVASGTFGYGREFSEFIDLNKLGGIVTKGTSLKPRPGNKPPRVCETISGMLNSIGLQNPGVEYFMENDLPWFKKFDTKVIVNACGSSIEEYVELAKVLNTLDLASASNNMIQNGILDISSIVYYLSVIGLFLFFTVQSIQKRRWS